MSHSTVLVIVREAGDPTEAEEKAEALLEPFNENTPVDRYKDYELGDPSEFWLVGLLAKEENPLPEPITWQAVAEAYNERYKEDGDHPLLVDERGAFQWSTYNPRSKWDWYELGGRWQGFFPVKRPLAGRRGRASWMGTSGHPTWADLAQVKDIDWEHLRHIKRIEAEER